MTSRLHKINKVANDSKTYETSSPRRETTRKGISGIVKSWMVYSIDPTETIPGVKYRKPHNVKIFWHYENGVKVGDVQMITYTPEDMIEGQWGMHKANDSSHTLCYQMLGALKYAAKKANKSISFCDSERKAKKLLNFGGEMIILRVAGGGTVWAVVREIKPVIVIDKTKGFKTFQERVDLLRGDKAEQWEID